MITTKTINVLATPVLVKILVTGGMPDSAAPYASGTA